MKKTITLLTIILCIAAQRELKSVENKIKAEKSPEKDKKAKEKGGKKK
jgi:hypothetical protein